MAREFVNEAIEDSTTFLDFVEENIELLLRSKRSFIICSKEGIPPILIKKDEEDIWITFINELQGI